MHSFPLSRIKNRPTTPCATPALLLLALFFALYASAVPSFDPFADATAAGGTSYTVGNNLVGQSNLTLFSAWYGRGSNVATTQPIIAAGSLTYSNLPASTGNSVLFVPANAMTACLDLNLPALHTNLVFYSFLLKITDLSTVPTSPTNNPIAAFLDDPSVIGNQIARLGSRLLTKKVGDGYVLGISRSANTGDFIYEPDGASHSTNDIVFVVGCYQRVAGVETNVLLWVNPPASSLGSNAPPPATVVATSGLSALNNNSARAFGIMCQFLSAPTGLMDEVRVATNWAFATGGDPAILVQPADKTVAEGNNATFSVTARGTATLTYQWIKDGTTPLANGGNISGADTATLTITSIGAGDLGTYSVYVTNGVGDFALSRSATLSFLTDPTITGQPQDVSANYGSNATFEVVAGGTPAFTYQWHKEGVGDLSDGGNISGAHSNILTVGNVAFPDGGNYWVTVQNNLGNLDSRHAALTVADPFITFNPVPVTTNAGAVATFHVAALGSGPFTYQWLKKGNLIFDLGNLSGTATDTLTVSNVSAADQSDYSATVIGPYSNAVSSAATLTVLSPASVLIQPRPRAVLAGVNAAFAVGAGGSGPFTYQWQREQVDIPGATSASYVLTNVQADAVGNYRAVISNSFSSVTSSFAALTISNNLSLAESNLVIIRVGDGAEGLTVNGNSMFLDQFAPDGSYVNTITIPDDGPGAMTAIGWDNINGVNTGSTTGSGLTRSLDGRFMVVAGYHTNLNSGASLATSFATNVNRGIGLIDSFGQYTLAVASTNSAFDQTFWRAAVTDGTNNYWGAAGLPGTYYLGFDAPPVLVQSDFANIRSMALFNGDIYCAGAVSGKNGVLKITGMPTTAVSTTILFAGSTGTYDMVVNPNGNLVYVTDQRNVANGGGIQRWDFDGSNWTLTYTLTAGFGNLGPRYIAADFSGPNPVLYVTSNDQTFDNNRLIQVVDTGAASAGTTLANAGANQTFRSVRFGPVPNFIPPRPLLSFVRDGNNLILSWNGAYFLQSAPEVTGAYSDVAGASSPYTNSVTATNQLFFRLRN